jgi:CheY-like chemotaxis protein
MMADDGDKCILQVEDDENDVFLLERVFKRAGIANPLRIAADGQIAIDYLAGQGDFRDRERYPLPCLVLLDLKLPKRDGLEVLEWIRRQPALRNLVVVVFSSSSLPQDIERAYKLGANSYVQKPSDAERALEIAQLFKGWWLDYNRFAPVYDTQ